MTARTTVSPPLTATMIRRRVTVAGGRNPTKLTRNAPTLSAMFLASEVTKTILAKEICLEKEIGRCPIRREEECPSLASSRKKSRNLNLPAALSKMKNRKLLAVIFRTKLAAKEVLAAQIDIRMRKRRVDFQTHLKFLNSTSLERMKVVRTRNQTQVVSSLTRFKKQNSLITLTKISIWMRQMNYGESRAI